MHSDPVHRLKLEHSTLHADVSMQWKTPVSIVESKAPAAGPLLQGCSLLKVLKYLNTRRHNKVTSFRPCDMRKIHTHRAFTLHH
jgi:hypothetical protein